MNSVELFMNDPYMVGIHLTDSGYDWLFCRGDEDLDADDQFTFGEEFSTESACDTEKLRNIHESGFEAIFAERSGDRLLRLVIELRQQDNDSQVVTT